MTPVLLTLAAVLMGAPPQSPPPRNAPAAPPTKAPEPPAQAPASPGATSPAATAAPVLQPPTDEQRHAAISQGLAFLVECQSGDGQREWPYEGVYRVGGEIPFGYRIGGTGIVAEALVRAPDYAKRPDAQAAVRRATEFICKGIESPLMNPAYNGGYDVRGWGYCYGARFLLALRSCKAVPEGLAADVDRALAWYLDAMQRTEIPSVGGWNYARKPGIETPCAAAPFMTGPCLQTLFEAKAQGLPVDDAVVARALDALERCRTPSGNFAYSAEKQTKEPDRSMPGAIGRMVCGEAVLLRAGRSDQARVRRAVDAFLEHWPELEKRRQKSGTHLPPYGVAPYYFVYGFGHAAEAIELLPEADRPALRARLAAILFSVRDADGTWNDRVFPRSRAFGTAMVLLALQRDSLPAPAAWASATAKPAAPKEAAP